MPKTKILYYSPSIPITAGELYDTVRNWVNPVEFFHAGFIYANSINNEDTMFRGKYPYPEIGIDFRFSAFDERSPLMIIGANKREMQRVASRLSRILKIPLTKIDRRICSYTKIKEN